MSDVSSARSYAAQTDAPESRVVLFVDEDENRRLLAEWLRRDPAYAVRLGADTSHVDAPFDLCIVDASALRRLGDALSDRRRERAPVVLPVLLLAPERDRSSRGRRERVPDADVVDDVVTVPVRQRRLQRRIHALLRTRRLSVDLGRSRDRYRRLVELLPDAVLLLSEDGRVVEVNRAAVDLFGVEQRALVDSPLHHLFAGDDADRARRLLADAAAGSDPRSETVTVSLETARNQHRLGEFTVARVPQTATDDPERFVGVLRDVTARLFREERLSVLDRVLRHNLRNQLTVILGRAELVGDGADERTRDHVATIQRAARRLLALSQKAQYLNREFSGERERLDLVPLVEDAVASNRSAAPEVTFTTTLPEEATVSGVEELSYALDEALRNAVDHNDADDPRVDVCVTRGDGHVYVTVSDNGPGLPSNERLAFEETLETPLEHASGLGLWIVAWLVRESGGSVTYERRDPRGSRLCLRLPAPDGTGVENDASTEGGADLSR